MKVPIKKDFTGDIQLAQKQRSRQKTPKKRRDGRWPRGASIFLIKLVHPHNEKLLQSALLGFIVSPLIIPEATRSIFGKITFTLHNLWNGARLPTAAVSSNWCHAFPFHAEVKHEFADGLSRGFSLAVVKYDSANTA